MSLVNVIAMSEGDYDFETMSTILITLYWFIFTNFLIKTTCLYYA